MVGDITFVNPTGFSISAFETLSVELDSSLDLSLLGAMESVESVESVEMDSSEVVGLSVELDSSLDLSL